MSKWLDHSSIVGHLGKFGQKISDPLAWIGGDKWTHLTSDVLPEKVNMGLSKVMAPFDKVDEKINPVRKIPVVDRVGDIVKNKPGDAAAIAAGAFFGGGALLGGGGAGGAGGAGAGGAEAGVVDGGSVNLFADAVPGAGGNVGASAGGAQGGAAEGGWQQYARQYGNLGQGQQQQQRPVMSDDPEMQQQDWEGANRALQRNQLGQRAQVLRQMIAQLRQQQEQPY